MKKEKKIKEKEKGKRNDKLIYVILIIFAIVFAFIFTLKYFVFEKFKGFDYEFVGELRSIKPSAGGSGTYTCKDAYGSDYKTCPENIAKGSEDYAKCCDSDEECCHKNKNAEPVCCSTERNPGGGRLYSCASFSREVDNKQVDFNYCKVENCVPPKSQKCSTLWTSVCCLPKPQEYCGAQTEDYNTPFCAIKTEKCPKGTFECYREDIRGSEDYLLCCNKYTESCDSTPVGGKKVCNPFLCSYAETLCQGIGEYSWRKTCCKIGEICFHQPNGYPKCV